MTCIPQKVEKRQHCAPSPRHRPMACEKVWLRLQDRGCIVQAGRQSEAPRATVRLDEAGVGEKKTRFLNNSACFIWLGRSSF